MEVVGDWVTRGAEETETDTSVSSGGPPLPPFFGLVRRQKLALQVGILAQWNLSVARRE